MKVVDWKWVIGSLLPKAQRLFAAHHSPINNCQSCLIGESLEARVDRLYFDDAVGDTLLKELYYASIWQEYEG